MTKNLLKVLFTLSSAICDINTLKRVYINVYAIEPYEDIIPGTRNGKDTS